MALPIRGGLVLLVAAIAACARPARADEVRPAPPPAAPASGVVRAAAAPHGSAAVVTDRSGLPECGWFAALRAGATLESSLGPGKGDHDVGRYAAELRFTTRLASRVGMSLEGQAEHLRWDFSDPDALVPGTGDLGGPVAGFRLGALVTWSVRDSFGVTLGPTLRAYAADGADLADALEPGFVAAVRVRLGGERDVFVGLSAVDHLETGLSITPVLGLGGVGDDDGASRWSAEARGPGVTLWYRLTGRLAAGFSAGYERRDVRLAPDDRLPDGVLREQRVPLALELAYRRRERLTLALAAGVSAWTRITFLDRDGERVERVEADLAPFVQLELDLRW
jgi:opacity protein-like surface antigen